jgi:gas vesicle protein
MSIEDGRISTSRESHLGSLFLATVLGVGVGLLAAPAPGSATRRALGKGFASLRDDLEDELEDLGEASGRARRAVRDRAKDMRRRGRRAWHDAAEQLEDLRGELGEDEDQGSTLTTVLTVAAGLAAAAYLLTSERAAPARERVRQAAATVREEAEDRWHRFQDRRASRGQTESGTRSDPAGSTPQSN